jgi:hypothetical protein
MTSAIRDPSFERFVTAQRKKLRQIASHTRGEYQFEDVVNEAWLMAETLASRKKRVVAFENAEFQDLLLAYLYQELVRYTELNVRHAVRLDHASHEDAGDDGIHPLMRTLASDEGRDPVALLIEHEAEALREEAAQDSLDSLAGAYVHLLRQFDNRMAAVAEHLLISTSYAYQRCAHARLLATHQRPMPMQSCGGCSLAGPWRRFRLQRTPLQLAFDFDDGLPLEPSGSSCADV